MFAVNKLKLYQMNYLSHKLSYAFALTRTSRKARFWKPKYYAAIPHYNKPHFIDIHDTYKLRNIEQVNAELKGRQFEITLERDIYKLTDPMRETKGRKSVMMVQMKQFELSQLQKERFKVLVGCRYKEESDELKLTCELYPSYIENHTKMHQMFYEIVMQTKRAP